MDLSALTIQQLRYLVAVDRHRSFRNAALASHVSQPALSMQIKRLEQLLGARIFDRSKQPVAISDDGAAIIAQAKLALEHFDRIGQLAAHHGGGPGMLSGSLRVGIIPTLTSTLIPVVVPLLARTHPELDVEFVETRTARLTRSLRQGTIDAGLAATPLEIAGLRERVLCHETLYVYLPERHAMLSQPRIRQSDLVDEQIWLLSEGHCFRTQVLHLCNVDRPRATTGSHRVRFDGGSFETLASIVDAGLGVTVLPELTVRQLSPARQAARVRPFVAPEPVRELSLVDVRDSSTDELKDALFAVIRAALPPDLVGRKPRRSAILKPTER
jgi:LysR family hydrogen peroxide-inducible transcriptional activator